jgi:diguanylate cyclase (GGDEF)-like protein
MKKKLWIATLILQIIGFCIVIVYISSGSIDGRALGVEHGTILAETALALIVIGVVSLAFFIPHLFFNAGMLLLLCAVLVAGAHLILPAGSHELFGSTPMVLFVTIFVVVYASGGSVGYWLSSLLLIFAVEAVFRAVDTGLFSGNGHGFMSAAFLLQWGRLAVLSGCVFMVARGRMRNRREIPTSIPAAPQTPAMKTPTTTMRAGANADDSNVDIGVNNTPGKVLSSVVYFMSRNFKAYSALGFVYAYSAERSCFMLNAFESRSLAIAPNSEIPLDRDALGAIGISKQSFMTGDCTLYNVEMPYYATNEMINSILAIPIVAESGELLGALVIDSKDKNAFTEQHKEILNRFSSLAAALIINVRMRIFQEQASRQFQIFYESSQMFTTALKVTDVIDVLFQMIGRIAYVARCVAVTFNQERTVGLVLRVAGNAAEIQEGMTFPLNDGIYSHVFHSRQVVSINDLAQAPNTYYRFFPDEPRNPAFRAIIVLPITDDHNQCRGVVSIESVNPHQYFGEIERVIQTLVGNASVAWERAQLYQEMERLATTDGLTGLSNHRTFQDALAKEVERTKRYNRPVSLLLLDIDHFKKFNDTYGHPVGDLVLKQISLCIRRSIRTSDLPARYGGEEFVVVIPETDGAGAMITAERIRSTIEGHLIVSGQNQLHVTVSIGCAGMPQSAVTQKDLIKCADKALYYGKEHGRNQATMYQKGM